MKDAILTQKFENLRLFPKLRPELLSKAEGYIRKSATAELLRVNPLRFAKDQNVSEEESIDLFVHATKVGLFDFAYNLLCPLCGGIVHTHHKLDEIQNKEFHCVACNVSIPTLLDDQVEVAFELHPSLREEEVNPFVNIDAYYRYYFSSNFNKSSQLLSWIQSTVRDFFPLEPETEKKVTVTLKADAEQGKVVQIVSIDRNAAVFFSVDPNANPEPEIQVVDLLDSGFLPKTKSLPPGTYTFEIHNRSRWHAGIQVITPNPDRLNEIYTAFPTKVDPFLTAKVLLNNQSFRELFRIHKLSPDLNLNVKSLTIMFTDLRGSTEMYDKAGDLFAYKLVQEHFRILTDTVREFKGAIVKTMGDAIMATFSSPLDGLMASAEMLQKIDKMNDSWKQEGHEIGLKVGLNEGPALAVINDERLDYFGQSVNIAARVQGLASSGEIWISESVWNAPGSQDQIQEKGFTIEKHSARLKGVGVPTTVFKLSNATSVAPQ
ncbi:adenylate/guanylate cyclase catalytic domain protein [Leptospira ryugenii]|uniref:Adenylate/guanylate cyclase catalytic domain protein n=1 Tax=Leptospira ryugenii TaxID=1917863 RepID=A0A2P2E447_9LEPT|nr:adenylate/guanylate cyclase domain-containing protein [Leptospira ryugenii]GBF51626.1 adenylate/guanylate cyclase catalytic domain protein [Leptospira ryugenii]